MALVGRQPGHVLALQLDEPGGRLLEAADHPQGRRLAAARGPEEAEELAVLDLEIDVVDGHGVAELLDDIDESDVHDGHVRSLSSRPMGGRPGDVIRARDRPPRRARRPAAGAVRSREDMGDSTGVSRKRDACRRTARGLRDSHVVTASTSGGSWPAASATAPAERRALPFRRAHARHRWGRVHRSPPRPRAGRARGRRRRPRRPAHRPGRSARCLRAIASTSRSATSATPTPWPGRWPAARSSCTSPPCPPRRAPSTDPSTTVAINRDGTATVMAAAARLGVRRVVLAGSSSVYGDAPGFPRRETQTPAPRSPYAVSKLAAEGIVHEVGARHGIETVVLRYFNVYGPGQDPGSRYAAVVPRFIVAALQGDEVEVHGDGRQSRDFTYVGDVVAANLLGHLEPTRPGLTCNIAGGRERSLLDLVAAIEAATGRTTSASATSSAAGRGRAPLDGGPAAGRANPRLSTRGPVRGWAASDRRVVQAPGSGPRPSGRSRRSRPPSRAEPVASILSASSTTTPSRPVAPSARPDCRRTSWPAGATG